MNICYSFAVEVSLILRIEPQVYSLLPLWMSVNTFTSIAIMDDCWLSTGSSAPYGTVRFMLIDLTVPDYEKWLSLSKSLVAYE